MSGTLNPGKFFIENLGCAKNQVDAETIISSLEDRGWTLSSADTADMIIINTCGFIKPAKEESIQTLISFRQQYPDKKIVLAGCLAQRYGNELLSSLTEADAFFGNRFPEEISLVADDFMNGRKRIYIPDKKTEAGKEIYPHANHKRISLSFPGSTYVKIAEGCGNNCTYCAIPLIRGRLKSRDEQGILDEIVKLTGSGFFEINLIAQDLASYGNDLEKKHGLRSLLEKISALEGRFWIRLLYMHPDRFDPGILDVMKSDSRILPYFDIPFQHASGNILSKMGRKGNFETYLKLVRKIRGEIENAVIRSTFLLGFPGEKKGDFIQVAEFLKEASLDWAGFFQYSREEGTPAFRMGSFPADYILSRKTPKRVSYLQELQTDITEKGLDRFTGQTLDILAEESIEGEEIVLGRGYLNAPEVDGAVIIHSGSVKPGSVVKCRITRRNNIDLEAVPL